MNTRVMRRRRTSTAKGQRLMKVEPPAMVNTAVAQQYQIDDGKPDLEDSDIEEIGRRNGFTRLKTHVAVVVDIGWCRF